MTKEEMYFKKNRVPKNVSIIEPTRYGEIFLDPEVRNDVFELTQHYLDSGIYFEDTKKVYKIHSCGQELEDMKDLKENLSRYKVPCEKARLIKMDEFESECFVYFAKESDYFKDEYLRENLTEESCDNQEDTCTEENGIEETLYFIKETKNTCVYGNEVIQNLYLPKDKLGFFVPDQVSIRISW